MRISLLKEGRKGWVDVLRGLAILLVVYGHNIGDFPEFFLYTSAIKLPLFFAISGYLLNAEKRTGDFMVRLTRTILVPWLLLGTLRVLLLLPLRGWDYFGRGMIRLLTGEDLWFMPCFILAGALHFCIRKYCSPAWLVVLLSLAAGAAGLLLHRAGWLNICMINRALTVQPFFLTGYYFRRYEDTLIKIKWGYLILAACTYIGLCFCAPYLFPSFELDVHQGIYTNIPYCLLLIYLGCLTLFIVARKASINTPILRFCGQNTLVIYLWSGGAVELLSKGLEYLGLTLPENAWTGLLMLVWACATCAFCSVLFRRYLPWVVGERPLSRSH